MNIKKTAPALWPTSSFGGPINTTPAELSALRTHMDRCRQSRGRMFKFWRAAEGLDCLVTRHPATIVVLVSLAMLTMMFVATLIG